MTTRAGLQQQFRLSLYMSLLLLLQNMKKPLLLEEYFT